MPSDRTGSTVIVTGGSSGLGAAVVSALAARGDRPVILDRAEPPGHPADFVAVDLTHTEEATTAVASVIEVADYDEALVASMLDKLVRLVESELGEDEAPFDLDLFGTREVRYRAEAQDRP